MLVGDVNVGKTRLICARAYRKTTPIAEFPKVAHNSSVWAIDQVIILCHLCVTSYEYSTDWTLPCYSTRTLMLTTCLYHIACGTLLVRMIAIGVLVSWPHTSDTLKPQKIAFGHADVVLLCFSICSHQSLRSIKRFWFDEVWTFSQERFQSFSRLDATGNTSPTF